MGHPQQAHFQQCEDFRSLCHHSHPVGPGKKLSDDEQKIYDMVTRRFLAVFYPAAEYRLTTRITRVKKDAFKTEGKVLVFPGWLAVYGKGSAGKDSETLVAVQNGETVQTTEIEIAENQTKPPPRFSKPPCCRPWKVRETRR